MFRPLVRVFQLSDPGLPETTQALTVSWRTEPPAARGQLGGFQGVRTASYEGYRVLKRR